MPIESMKDIVECNRQLSKFHTKWRKSLSFHDHTNPPLSAERTEIFKQNLHKMIKLNEADNQFNVSTNHLSIYSFEEIKAKKLMKSTKRHNHAKHIQIQPKIHQAAVSRAKASIKQAKAKHSQSCKKSNKKLDSVRPQPNGMAAALDWRNVNGKSFVTSVKNQPCGTCWYVLNLSIHLKGLFFNCCN